MRPCNKILSLSPNKSFLLTRRIHALDTPILIVMFILISYAYRYAFPCPLVFSFFRLLLCFYSVAPFAAADRLFFRNERERDAYRTLLQTRMAAAGLEWGETREEVPGRKGAKDGYQLSCGKFKMHVLESDR